MNHLTTVGVHGQSGASCHDVFITRLKHSTARVLSKDMLLAAASISAGREHAMPKTDRPLPQWITLFIHIHAHAFRCLSNVGFTEHRSAKPPTPTNSWGVGFSKSQIQNFSMLMRAEYGSHHIINILLLVLGECLCISSFDSHLYCPLKAAEHWTGLV